MLYVRPCTDCTKRPASRHCERGSLPRRTFEYLCASAGEMSVRICRCQSPTAPDRMNAKTRGKMWQNSPPPQESTSPPARSIASQRGSADRTKSSAVVASTSSTAHTAATISRRESAGRSASESRSTVKRYARPAASVLICRAARVCAWQGIGVLRSWRQLLERPRVAVRVAEGNKRAPRLNVHVTGLHTAFDKFPPRRLDIRHDNLDAFL
jgi:hypothetical protein